MTFVLNLACDKGVGQGELPGAWCGGLDENKIVSFFFFLFLSGLVLPFPPLALRTAGFRNGSVGNRPSAPFRSNVYQPTEMAVVLNGGTVSIRG